MKKNVRKLAAALLALVVVFGLFGTVAEAASKGYQFKYSGVTVSVHGDATKLIKKAGKPEKRTKSKSCAYDGEDITYQYKDFTLVTYTNKKGGTEYVQTIEFKTDKVKTKEGIKLGSSKKTMIKKYGKCKDNFGVYIYKKGKMGLSFAVDEKDKITEIQYIAYQ